MVASYDITKHYSVSNHLIELLNYGQWSYYLKSVYTAETYKPLFMEKSIHQLLLYLLMPHKLYFNSYSKIFQGNTDNSHYISGHRNHNMLFSVHLVTTLSCFLLNQVCTWFIENAWCQQLLCVCWNSAPKVNNNQTHSHEMKWYPTLYQHNYHVHVNL